MHYVLLDWSFLLGHTALIFFNLLGWLWPRTRRLNFACILITLASWLAFAPWYGLGYCPCTDWHWQIKEALGENNLPNNYLTYLFDTWTGLKITDSTAELLAWTCLTPALVASLALNLNDLLKTRKHGSIKPNED